MFKTVSVWTSVLNYTFKYTSNFTLILYPVIVIVNYYDWKKMRYSWCWVLVFIQIILRLWRCCQLPIVIYKLGYNVMRYLCLFKSEFEDNRFILLTMNLQYTHGLSEAISFIICRCLSSSFRTIIFLLGSFANCTTASKNMETGVISCSPTTSIPLLVII